MKESIMIKNKIKKERLKNKWKRSQMEPCGVPTEMVKEY